METQVNNPNEEKSQLVQMRLKPRTIRLIDNLSKLTKITNRTLIVSSSIQLTEEIVESIQDGGKVYIEDKDGNRSLIKIIGL
jgi:hypothetical protein